MLPRISASVVPSMLVLLLIAGCGGQPDVPPDDLDIPNTLPREQILYREAKDVFSQWIAAFDDEPSDAYSLLTWKSRQVLKDQGVANEEAFRRWFAQQKDAGKEPFVYTFARVDVLEIGLNDTNRAAITATFVVHIEGQKLESVGIFYLKREHNSWKVPFVERADFIRGWWQKDQNFDVTVGEAGISSYASGEYKVEFKYPVAWDVSENQTFKLPLTMEGSQGLKLTYTNPSTQEVETVVRIAELPESMVAPELLADTTLRKLKPVREEMTHVFSEPGLSGRLYWLYNPARKRILAIYGTVDTTRIPFGTYAESIDDLVRSVVILK